MGLETVKTARRVADLRAGRNDWFRIENGNGRGSKVYIYDEIGYFGVTASDFVAELGKIDSPTLAVHINSPGGDVFDGVSILNALRSHGAEITTVVDGLAASAASFIAQAGSKRIMSRNSEMMIHDASGLCIGNANDMRTMLDLLERTSDNIASVYAERSGIGDATFWRTAMSAETWYSADEAVTAGLADEVDGKAKEAPAANWDLSLFAYASRHEAPAPTLEAPKPPQPAPFDISLFKKGLRHGA